MGNRDVIATHSHPEPNSGCWLWTAAVNRKGYGVSFDRDRRAWTAAHRLSYAAYTGAIPAGAHVCHRCDNPSCVNPDHLFVGSAADNMRDSARKGRRATGLNNGAHTKPERAAKGERHGCAKLSVAKVVAILSSPRPNRQLSAEFGVSISTIQRIKARRLWRNVHANV